jgi:hypothetical protein
MSVLPEGFIPHDGGQCPVKTSCDVVCRSGFMPFVSNVFEGWVHSADRPRWFDVIAYRPTQQEASHDR